MDMKNRDKWNCLGKYDLYNITFRGLIMPYFNKKIYFRAAATLEASLVIPLFIYAVMTVAYIIYAIGVKEHVSQALYNDTRYMARYVYMTRDVSRPELKVLLYSMAQEQLYNELGYEYAQKHNIAGGNAGLIISCTSIIDEENNIRLAIRYAVKNPFDIFGTGRINFEHSYVAKAWFGEEYKQENNEEDIKYVYITSAGEVYHTQKECTYLKPSVRQVNADYIDTYRNSSGAIYYQCERCDGSKNTDGCFYITDYGTCYHTTPDCSGIKRSVVKIKLSCVGDRRLCIKCMKNGGV